jgi:hypothetical protein
MLSAWFMLMLQLGLSLGAIEERILPTAWPVEFSVKFVSNVSTELKSPREAIPIEGTMYYNWRIQKQRVDHGAGAIECLDFYNSTRNCTLYFTPDGLYRRLTAPLPPGEPECCLDMPEIKASPPNWAILSDPEFKGITQDSYSGERSAVFDFPKSAGPKGCHTYSETSLAGVSAKPVVFTFPAHDGRQDYHFDSGSMLPRPQSSRLFDLPAGCERKLCKSNPHLDRSFIGRLRL